MLCIECKKRNAVVHMTKVINGKKEEIHLCETCAKHKDGGSIDHHFSIPHFLAGMMENNVHPNINLSHQGKVHCNACGTTLTQVKQTGRLGCDDCYEIFREKINPLIRRIHGNIKHVGKVPKRSGGEIRLKRQVTQLRLKLKEAIEAEEFEKAAEIRDKIRGLEDDIMKI